MKRTFVLTSAVAAGLAMSSLAAFAQAAPAAAPAAPAAVKPEAIPAKVAIIAFEEAVAATNEDRAVRDGRRREEDIERIGHGLSGREKSMEVLAGEPPLTCRGKLPLHFASGGVHPIDVAVVAREEHPAAINRRR